MACLFNDSSLKGAHFIQLCDKNRTPLLFLQNINWLHGWPRVRAAAAITKGTGAKA